MLHFHRFLLPKVQCQSPPEEQLGNFFDFPSLFLQRMSFCNLFSVTISQSASKSTEKSSCNFSLALQRPSVMLCSNGFLQHVDRQYVKVHFVSMCFFNCVNLCGFWAILDRDLDMRSSIAVRVLFANLLEKDRVSLI